MHGDKKTLGFWIYLMTDLLMFAALFATFAVLRNNTFGGPSGAELFSLPFVFIETLLLLTSSFTIGLAMIAIHANRKNQALVLLGITFLLGAVFVGMELKEFNHLIAEGHDWTKSAFLSSFFALLGTHGFHIVIGLLWIVILSAMVMRRGLNSGNVVRLTMLSLFWHFLDLVWIFIFTIVYLMGMI